MSLGSPEIVRLQAAYACSRSVLIHWVERRGQNRKASDEAHRIGHSERPGNHGGTPVFVGARVPFQTLLDYLEAGQPLAEFLDDFPTVSRDQAVAALEQAKEALFARACPA
jgi:uncharacterized protein (DUF433 family)